MGVGVRIFFGVGEVRGQRCDTINIIYYCCSVTGTRHEARALRARGIYSCFKAYGRHGMEHRALVVSRKLQDLRRTAVREAGG